MKVLEILIAFFLPPVAVLLKKGLGKQVLIALLLQILGHIPGVVYALYVITQDDDQVVRA
jgi:uncharacterized membrane protein YqaE (UPF0057 family)